jgi:hypothetical protein
LDWDTLLTVYPNPTDGIVHVEIPNQTIQRIKVYDLQGQIVKESTESQLNLTKVRNGIYFLEAYTNQEIYRYKLIKQ